MSPYRTVSHFITPPEVKGLAENYEAAAREAQRLYHEIDTMGSDLKGNWVGTAKDVFFNHYDPFPDHLYQYALYLREAANQIRAIKVEVFERQWYNNSTGK